MTPKTISLGVAKRVKCLKPLNLTKKLNKYSIIQEAGVYTVPCGWCLACRINITSEWTTRIIHESRCQDDNVWCTLTYNDSTLPENGTLVKRDLQLFFKKMRRYQKRFRYFASGEYGENYQRPHYHCILFGVSSRDEKLIRRSWFDEEKAKNCWATSKKEWEKNCCLTCTDCMKGFIHVGKLNETTARYTAGYIQKKLRGAERQIYDIEKKSPEFCVSSRKPGIGSKFAEDYIKVWLQSGSIALNGSKKPIPRYYLSKANKEDLSAYRERSNIQKFTEEVLEAQEKGKTIYEIMSQHYAERKQIDENLRKKQALFERHKL